MEPIIVGSSSSMTGTTLQTIRERLLETLGYFATGTISTQAASLEADRMLISDSWKSDQAPPEDLDGLFVYVRNGDQARTQRRVVNGAFDGPLGALTADYPYAAALQVGTFFEVAVLPAAKYQGTEGANHIINLALEELPVVDYVSITVTATDGVVDTQYSLAGYPWPIKSVEAVAYDRQLPASERRREMPRGQWAFVNDGESPILSFHSAPGNSGDTIEVRLHRPANTRIKSSGSWGDSTTGLSLEDDACLYDAATVVRQARPIALQRMALLHRRGSKERDDLLGEAAEERATAALSRFYGRFRGNGAQRIGAIGGR